MKIGLITDCLKQNTVEDAIRSAAAMGLHGVQIYATTGEFSPDVLDDGKITHYRNLLSELHIEISALCGDMGGYGFEIEADNAERVEKTKRIIDLAVSLGTSVVTTHIGVIPDDKSHPRYAVMLRALQTAGAYAHAHGITLAIETGPEKAAVLAEFVQLAGPGVGVNLDPANFVMVTGQDPTEAVYLLQDKIVHTHAKDGRMLESRLSPTDVYHAFAVGGVEALNACTGFAELPLGEGNVDWDAYLAALRDIGYDGYLTIERETGDDPVADIEKAIIFLQGRI